jgi:hypothetical protein
VSLNSPKSTWGLDALSIFPFLSLMTTPIKAYKRYVNEAFEFSDLEKSFL